MKKRTLYIISVALIPFIIVYLLFVHDLVFNYTSGNISSGFVFRFNIRWWELSSIIGIIIIMIYLFKRKPTHL
jgi:hypothetical protein